LTKGGEEKKKSSSRGAPSGGVEVLGGGRRPHSSTTQQTIKSKNKFQWFKKKRRGAGIVTLPRLPEDVPELELTPIEKEERNF